MSLTKPDLKQIKDLIHQELSRFYTTLIQTNYPTKQDLKKELSKYATKNDLKSTLKKELSNYPTKQDLKKELSKYATKDDLLTGFDEVMTELKAIRQESQILSGRVYKKHQPQLEDHEERIDTLEGISVTA